MATTIDQQVALDEALVPSTQRLRIGRSNFRLPSDIQSKESTLQVVYDVLWNSPFFMAFLVIADVPEVYMQELWATAKLHHLSIRFKIDTKKCVLDLEAFREMLHISPRIPSQSFAELPTEEEILEFLRYLGHSHEIRHLTDVNVNKLYQPWRSFALVINKCLTGKSSGIDSFRLSQAQILWGLYHRRNVDFAYLIWEDFVYQVEHKNQKRSNKMYYPRFTKVTIDYFMTRKPSIPRRNRINWHYVRDDVPNSKAYKEYYACATGEAAPKPKASAKKKKGDFASSTTPSTPTPTTTVVTMATTIDQQVALDEALVPSTAFLVTADVPEVYMQEFWATAKLHHNSIRFKMDTKKSILDLEAFREMLHISPRIPSHSFAELPTEEEILEFFRDDVLFTTIKVVSRHQTTQQYGAILPIELTTDDIRNSKAYKEYYACATGEAAPKPKASARKKKDDSASFTTPPTLTPTTTVVSAPRLSATAKGKQPARATTPTEPTDVERTEAERLKIVLKRSRQETHISQQRSSGTDEGTGSRPGVPDVPSDDSEEELSWNSFDDEDVGVQDVGDKNDESDDGSADGNDDDIDETVKAGSDKDDDDNDEEEETTKNDKEDT
nr:hypothetical protein [Tanacetum cinerariifolium]